VPHAQALANRDEAAFFQPALAAAVVGRATGVL
jgi:hypothetical protein